MKKLTLLILVLAIAAFELFSAAAALAEGTTEPAEPPPVQTEQADPSVIVIEADPDDDAEIGSVERPTPTVYCYQWTQSTLDMFARGYWKLDTMEQKLAFTIVSVNRFLNAEKRSDGKLLFSTDGSLEGVVTKFGEFEFYDPNSHISKDNLDLAEFFLNVCMTARLTKEYTGYAVPSTALYFGKTSDGKVALYAELGEPPIYVYN